MAPLRSPLPSARLKTFAIFVVIFGQIILFLKLYDILFLLQEHRALILNQNDNCPDIPQIADFQQLLRENRIDEMTKASLPTSMAMLSSVADKRVEIDTRPMFIIFAQNRYNSTGNFEKRMVHVRAAFHQWGFRETEDMEADWSVLWSHGGTFLSLKSKLARLHPYQMVNQLPGSGAYTKKDILATSGIKGTPKSFKLPEQQDAFLKYAKQSDQNETMWVQKNDNHRGINIRKAFEVNLTETKTFVQEFISNPLLVSGHKFDIGIYTVVTSVSPLRAYTWNGEAQLRFCPIPYHPFNESERGKYIVKDDYLPTWKIPALQNLYTEHKCTYREALNRFIRQSIKKSPTVLWNSISATIRAVLINKIGALRGALRPYHYPSNFFQMTRFDFVPDENLNPVMMESNLSPNLEGYFEENTRLFDQKCQICATCASNVQEAAFRKAYTEHINRREMRRVAPQPIPTSIINQLNQLDDENPVDRTQQVMDIFVDFIKDALPLAPQDVTMAWWFYGKCVQDRSWCS